ncbi:MAG: selenocysteine-specific translation elongation factor [Firmicutes bacterium HGW-Firmicutes-13]|nr:MAG: selenocysteine-specific translation elongation factor [Firmicutes bacterium HGW-Firmicutes-13]
MKSVIVGTAGHVDHGKTMLIKALTGRDTDRLREEKERGITIELGFAPFRLPSGRLAGVIDVPGHEKFIHNMLAGIGGIDLVILVIDAAEGVMPQTREHLDILQLLEIKKGLVVITKIDTVEEEWLDLVEEEIRDELKGTFLEDAVIHRVSALKGSGIEELKTLLDNLMEEVHPKKQESPLRIPVDRVFSLFGFGTIVTGTLLSGTISVGETVEILPPKIEARLRQIQVFDRSQEKAVAGQRVALNLAGIEKDSIERGDVIVKPGFYKAAEMFDARLKLLPAAKKPLVNLAPVHLYLGAKRLVARVFLLEREELLPGESTLVQCRLDRPVVAYFGDRFIIRSFSPMTTIGGGIVLDGKPARHKRFKKEVISRLKILEEGDPAQLILQKLEEKTVVPAKDLQISIELPEDIINNEIKKLIETGRVIFLSGSLLSSTTVEKWKDSVIKTLAEHYRNNNLSSGLSKAQLKSHISSNISQKDYDLFLDMLEREKTVQVKGEVVSFFGYEIKPALEETKMLQKIEELHLSDKFSPPTRKDLAGILKVSPQAVENLLAYLFQKGILIKINEDFFLHREVYGKLLDLLSEYFNQNPEITVSDLRTFLGTSRKYALPILEYCDQKKLTRRIEDRRIPWKIKE